MLRPFLANPITLPVFSAFASALVFVGARYIVPSFANRGRPGPFSSFSLLVSGFPSPPPNSPLSRPPARLNPYNIYGRHSSTEADGLAGERRLDDRARPSNLRNRRGRTLPPAQFHPPACARSFRRRGHRPGSLLRTGGSKSPADAHRARDRLAFSRRAQSHHRPFPQEEAGGPQRRSARGRRRRTSADRRSVAIARCRPGSALLPQRASG